MIYKEYLESSKTDLTLLKKTLIYYVTNYYLVPPFYQVYFWKIGGCS